MSVGDLDLNTLRQLNAEAREAIHTGAALDVGWFKDGVRKVSELQPPNQYSNDEEALIITLRSRRLFADLADRRGRLRTAEALIGNDLPWVEGEVARSSHKERSASWHERLAELLWYVVVHSLVEHRRGNIQEALAHVKGAESALNLFNPEEFLSLRHRIAFAIGRHEQSLGTRDALKAAEAHYTRALYYCEQIARKGPMDDRKPYARYRLAVTLVALARVFLERGELARSLRECYAAKTLLETAETAPDQITTSYVDYLIGSILRQQGKDPSSAITLLEQSCGVFIHQGHRGHYSRCRHELAKAYLNGGDYSLALDTINRADLGQDDRSNPTWEANDLCLKGRIMLEQLRRRSDERPLGMKDLEVVEDILERGFGKLPPSRETLGIVTS